MIKELKELIEESEQNLKDMLDASISRGYDETEHIEEQAWEEGYQSGLRTALRLVEDLGFGQWEEQVYVKFSIQYFISSMSCRCYIFINE